MTSTINKSFGYFGRRLSHRGVRLSLAPVIAFLLLGMIACGGGKTTTQVTPTPESDVSSEAIVPTATPFTGDLPTIWVDDFERYAIGDFPRAGGWQRWKSGGVMAVTTESSGGGSKSYKITDIAYTAKRVPQNLSTISLTGKFMAREVDGVQPAPVVMIGLGWRMDDGNIPHATACGVWIRGLLMCGGKDLGQAEAGRWYEFHMIADLDSGTARYWLDGNELGEVQLEQTFGNPKDNITAVLIVNGQRRAEAYVDDLAVFEGEVLPLASVAP